MKNLIALLLGGCMALKAQNSDSTDRSKFQIKWVQAQIGGLDNVGDSKFNIQDFKNLAPNSKLLQNDFKEYENNDGYYYFSPGIVAVSVDIGLQRNNSKKRKLDYLFGIGYMHDLLIGSALSKKTKIFDNTYVNPEGEQIVRFKEAGDVYTMIYQANMINLKAATYYHTSKEKNIYFGIGAEASAGLLIGANTSVSFQTDTIEDTEQGAKIITAFNIGNIRPMTTQKDTKGKSSQTNWAGQQRWRCPLPPPYITKGL